MKNHLTEETRKAILNIKEAMLHLPIPYASIFIYQAVLELGIRHVDEFYNGQNIITQLYRFIGKHLGLKIPDYQLYDNRDHSLRL